MEDLGHFHEGTEGDDYSRVHEHSHAHGHTHAEDIDGAHGHEHAHEHSHAHGHTHAHGHDGAHGHEHAHEHSHGHGHTHTHTHGGHHHVHSEEEKRAVINRLSRAIGHLESVKRMVERDEDCTEVLIQLAAVRNAINNTGKLVMKNHISHCIVEAIEEDDLEAVEALNKAIDRFIK